MRRRVLTAALLVSLPASAWARGIEFAGVRADDPAREPATYLGVDVGDSPFDTEAAKHHAFLGDVMDALEANDTPIAANTVRALASHAVELDTLDRLTPVDCAALLRENPRLWTGIASPEECVAGVPVAVLSRVTGYQNGNRIYVNPFRPAAEMASTVVHELNHFVNDSNAHYATQEEIAREEYRAFWVAQRFEDHGRAAGPAWTGWLKQFIVREYGLDSIRPEDLPDTPDGNLDNAVPSHALSLR